jgi:serine protease Do
MRIAVRRFAVPALALGIILGGTGIMPSVHAQSRSKSESVMVMQGGGSYLGIQMEDVTAQNMANYKLSTESGVIVKSVEKGSPAESAKLQANDVILEYGHSQVISATQFSRLVRETPIGRKVDLLVSRDGKKMTLSAEIGKREESVGENRDWEGNENMPGLMGPEGRSFQFQLPDGRTFNFGGTPGETNTNRPRLGVSIQELTDQMAEFLGVPGKKGVLVLSVENGSAADGKLKAGDVIISANDKAIKDPEDLQSEIARVGEGKVDLKVVRNRAEISVAVNLPEKESSGRKGERL